MAEPTEGAPPPKRGHAAWKEAQENVSQRNADAHKQAQQSRTTRDDAVAERNRRDNAREADQLRALNKQIAKRGGGGQR
jgi:hypothetical protein